MNRSPVSPKAVSEASGTPWHERVVVALPVPPKILWHATTPKKLARYEVTSCILPPVRGFDSEAAAREWGRLHGRGIILKLDVAGCMPQALPDHHLSDGLAWWCPIAVSRFERVKQPLIEERP